MRLLKNKFKLYFSCILKGLCYFIMLFVPLLVMFICLCYNNVWKSCAKLDDCDPVVSTSNTEVSKGYDL